MEKIKVALVRLVNILSVFGMIFGLASGGIMSEVYIVFMPEPVAFLMSMATSISIIFLFLFVFAISLDNLSEIDPEHFY